MKDMVELILEKLILYSCIENSEMEIYRYGLRKLINSVLNFLIIIIIGIVYNELFIAILYAFSYILLRRYSGGYHSKSLIRCYIFSILKIIFVLNIIYYINVYKINTFFITLISSIVILFLSPVECKNKRLDQDEKKVYKNKSMRVTLFIYLIYLLVYFTNNYISTTFSVSIFMVAFLIILGKIDSNLITKRH